MHIWWHENFSDAYFEETKKNLYILENQAEQK